ncbi:helix-turn-helix domain-containing protein [Mangrovicoccus sp. HB161399]|uniref:helix-turn-helix domain-containing protein n=1 Tax=Mangrovicoccus sp. HB161399 TaxID=2720392 RepID=UPI0015541D71|nr:helix-turn-helix domain-containing protein [Mangrovicoccus sp. HB161399]
MLDTEIPLCFLYGDPISDVEMDFLHIEPIRERSGAHDWIIHEHSHPEHVQLLLVERGGGLYRVEGQEIEVPVGSLIVVPAGMVHEFHFASGTDGYVINAATAYLRAVAGQDARLAEPLSRPAVYPAEAGGADGGSMADLFRWCYREYVWSAPGRRAAIQGQMLQMLVALMRAASEAGGPVLAAGDRDYALVCRFREALEDGFRTSRSIADYARALGVTTHRLNQACRARAGKSPSGLLHERTIVEAKRYLIYMERSVAEIGYELGFEDPAYFSRYFTRRVGRTPGAYRRAMIEGRARAALPEVQ